MGSPAENKALVRRFYEEIDRGNIAILDELVAEDYVDHNPPPFPTTLSGRERLKQDFRLFQQATPGYHVIEDQIAEGDKVVTRLTSYGKHEGDLPGAPRTDNDMKMTSITIHRIANGKLVEKWAEKDMIALLRQIGGDAVATPVMTRMAGTAKLRHSRKPAPGGVAARLTIGQTHGTL